MIEANDRQAVITASSGDFVVVVSVPADADAREAIDTVDELVRDARSELAYDWLLDRPAVVEGGLTDD